MNKSDRKYVDLALSVFKEEGMSLSLEQIADKMGVTKKTLYNHFESKEDLIQSCVKSFLDEVSDEISIMIDEDSNAVEGLIIGFRAFFDCFRVTGMMFLRDLNKFPLIQDYGHKTGMSMLINSIKGNINIGVKSGLYRKNMNIDFVSRFFIYSTIDFLHSRVMHWNDFNVDEFFINIIDYHLNAITTEKGKAMLKNFKAKY